MWSAKFILLEADINKRVKTIGDSFLNLSMWFKKLK